MGAITTEVVETGEKRDRRGRRMTPGDRRAQMVQVYRASGTTMASFARRERIDYATFAGWVAKAQRTTLAKPSIKFAEMTFPFAPTVASLDQLEVRLLDGTVLRGNRVVEVVALVRALRSCVMLAFPAAIKIYVAGTARGHAQILQRPVGRRQPAGSHHN